MTRRITAKQIVRTIENAPISEVQRAFRLLGWPLRLVLADDPQPEYAEEEQQP